jgi:hypothetical protein
VAHTDPPFSELQAFQINSAASKVLLLPLLLLPLLLLPLLLLPLLLLAESGARWPPLVCCKRLCSSAPAPHSRWSS